MPIHQKVSWPLAHQSDSHSILLCLLNEITMPWFQINISPSALCVKVQPTTKRGTLIQWFHPLPCTFATHKHLLQKGSQTATSTSISWGEHDWRSQSRVLGQDLKLELLQWYTWMISSSAEGRLLFSSFAVALKHSVPLVIMTYNYFLAVKDDRTTVNTNTNPWKDTFNDQQ